MFTFRLNMMVVQSQQYLHLHVGRCVISYPLPVRWNFVACCYLLSANYSLPWVRKGCGMLP